MKTYKVRIKKSPMKMGGYPRYQEGADVPGQNEFDYGMMSDGYEPTRGSLKGSVNLSPTDANYPLISIPAGPQQPMAAPSAAQAPANAYQGNSVYDYLTAQGQKADYASRKEMAKSLGIDNYKGSAGQNLALLEALRNGSRTASPAASGQAVISKTPAGKVQGRPAASVTQAPENIYNRINERGQAVDAYGFTKEERAAYNAAPGYPATKAKVPVKGKAAAPARNSMLNDVTNFLTGSRNYEEYSQKNPYFFNFAGVDDTSPAWVKGLDKPFHAVEDQIAQAVYNGDPDAITNLITMAAMGRGAIRHTMPGRGVPGVPPKGLPGFRGLPGGGGAGRALPGLRGLPAGREFGGEEMMAYGGQAGYGLDLNSRRVYTDMPEETQVGRTLAPVDREDATYEAEKNEVIVGDMDKDGKNESLVFGGKRHSEGGTPAKEQGFIYSNTKKLALRGPILEEFGKTPGKKAYTPAELAKQYDLNKYKAVLDDPNADSVAKRTAEIMYQNQERKLAKLAAAQESMKGFPQGLPEITQRMYPELAEQMMPSQAAYGGMYMATGGKTPPKWLQPWTKSNTVAGRMSKTDPSLETVYNPATGGNTMVDDYQYWSQHAGRDFTDAKDLQNYVFDTLIKKNPTGVNEMLGSYGYPNANTLSDGILGARSAWAMQQRMPETVNATPGTAPALDVKGVPVNIPLPQLKAPGTAAAKPQVPGTPATTAAGTKLPYNAFDVANLGEALTRPVKSYGPRMVLPDVQQQQGVFDQADYNPLLSANNTRMAMNSTFGNTGAAMAANAYNPELMQGLIQETNRARGNNLQTANQLNAANTQIGNQANTMRSQLAQDNYDKWIKTQEETDIAEKMKYRMDVMPAAQNMQNNRTNMQRFNMMYPQYAVTGPLWDQVAYQGNGYSLGQKAPTGTQGADMSTFLAQFPGMKALYDSNDPAKKTEVEKEFIKYQNQQMMNMSRNPKNMYYNQKAAATGYGYNPYLDE